MRVRVRRVVVNTRRPVRPSATQGCGLDDRGCARHDSIPAPRNEAQMSTSEHPPAVYWRLLTDIANVVLPRRRWADRLWHRLRFRVHHGRALTDAMRFNDYLVNLAMSPVFRDPLVVLTTCKAGSKTFLRLLDGTEHVVPTLGLLRSRLEIDAFEFPETCVIKGTATSGQVLLKRAGEAVDRRILRRWLGYNRYRVMREANYGPLDNAVIVEPVIGGTELADDIKMVCRGGRVRWVYCNIHGSEGTRRRVFNREWQVLPVSKKLPVAERIPPRPRRFDEMVAAAEKVAGHFDLVRVDFFLDGEDWWYGEITHFEAAGLTSFIPLEGEQLINELTFGEAAYQGPLEKHGAMGASGV